MKSAVLTFFIAFLPGAMLMLILRAHTHHPNPKPQDSPASSTQAQAKVTVSDTAQRQDAARDQAHKASEMQEIWVCAQDPSIGLSYPSDCPIDGEPMVKREVDLSQLTPLNNPTCPVMGGEVREEIFAIYEGKVVHFCCQGCDRDFFADAQAMPQKAEAKE